MAAGEHKDNGMQAAVIAWLDTEPHPVSKDCFGQAKSMLPLSHISHLLHLRHESEAYQHVARTGECEVDRKQCEEGSHTHWSTYCISKSKFEDTAWV